MSASQIEADAVRDDSVDEIPVEPRRRLELLDDCRELVVSRLSTAIAEALDKVGSELTALALREVRPESQQALLDAVTLVRRHRGDIQLRFRETFASIFERRVNGEGEDAEPRGSGELALVDDSEMHFRIALEKLLQRARSKLDPDEVLGMRARMGALVDRDWFEENRQPASPEAVFEALRRVFDQMNAEAGVRQALLEAIEPHVSANLNSVYSVVNERLRSNHILTRIRPRVVTSQSSARAAPRPDESRNTGPGAGGGGVATPGPAGGEARQEWFESSGDEAGVVLEGDPFAQLLEQLGEGTPAARRLAARMLAAPASFAAAAGAPPPAVAFELVESLNTIQSGGGRSGAGGSQLLAELLEQSRAKGSPLDQLTVEIVSLVFDQLYADRRLPDPVKQQLLRLQVVAVKAALIDRSFFASRQHPMRRLLDGIYKAAIDPEADTRPDSELVGGIAEIVDWLIASFDNDLSVFDDASMRLDMLLSIETQRHAEQQAMLVREAQRLEALAVAQEQARAEIALRTDPATPEFVRDFLERWWSGIVARARIDGGADDWAGGLRCVEALVWSVTPKSSDEIPRLASLLPKMIGELMRGLQNSGIDGAERERFFNELLRWHTRAIQRAKAASSAASTTIRGGAPDGAAKSRTGSAPAAEPQGPGRREAGQRAGEPRVEDAGLSPGIVRAIGELRQGETLELLEPDGSRKRVRLAWISPSRKLFMLTRFPDVALPVERVELGRWLESGRVRLADAETTLDRAIGAIAAGRAPLGAGAGAGGQGA